MVIVCGLCVNGVYNLGQHAPNFCYSSLIYIGDDLYPRVEWLKKMFLWNPPVFLFENITFGGYGFVSLPYLAMIRS